MNFEKGWLARRVRSAAAEFDSWPTTVKAALALTTSEPPKKSSNRPRNLEGEGKV